jgi:GT2 family glycosyltransferase
VRSFGVQSPDADLGRRVALHPQTQFRGDGARSRSNRSIRPVAMSPVGVVILTYEGAQLTLDCLASLHADGYEDRVDIVVDNGSSDGVLERVIARYPRSVCVEMGANVGFSAGNNAGIVRAVALGCDQVLVLNNDTLVEPGALRAMVRVARDRRVVAPLLVFAEAPQVAWYAGGTFNPRSGLPGRMTGYRTDVSRLELRPGPTERFTGAAVLIPAAAVRDVGVFDEALFFLFEDVDWSMRLRRAGYEIHFEPSARIRHRVAQTQAGEHSLSSYYYGTRNQLAVSEALCPLPRLRAAQRAVTALAVQLARTRRAASPTAAARACLEGFNDWRHQRLGPWAHHGSAS